MEKVQRFKSAYNLVVSTIYFRERGAWAWNSTTINQEISLVFKAELLALNCNSCH
jgi:hypothetical protein